jgi:hypothetical protein
MAIGVMPNTIAIAVIKIARKRLTAPSRAASNADWPSRRWRSAKLTNRIEFATAMPIAIIAPMNDSIFKVVPVIRNIRTTPQSTAGTVRMMDKAKRKD